MSRLSDVSIVAWIQEHGIKTSRGEPYDLLGDHRYFYDIVRDFSPYQAVTKAAQIGASEGFGLKLFFLADKVKADIIYTLPSADDMKQMVGSKFNRLISQNPILQKLTKDRDTIEQKQVGNSIIHFRGTMTERTAMMVPADILVHDEVDASDQATVAQYLSRLQASKLGWRWFFSHPTTEQNGISRYFADSDQKQWHITCPKCKAEQIMSWPESFDMERGIYICRTCEAQIDRETRRMGYWKATSQGKFSGYHIPLYICPWIDAEYIIEAERSNPADFFHNKVLGLPYATPGGKFTGDMVYDNLTDDINYDDPIVIGCDSGLKKHYVIGNMKNVFYNGVADDWSEIEYYLDKRFPRSIAVIDALPDLTEPRKLRDKYPGRVFLCHYAQDRKTMQMIRWGSRKESGTVLVDRNRSLQFLSEEMSEGTHEFYGEREDWESVVQQLETVYRVEDTNTLGQPVFKWESTNGNDHFCHALLYYRVGLDRFRFGGKVINDMPAPKGEVSPHIEPDGTGKVINDEDYD